MPSFKREVNSPRAETQSRPSLRKIRSGQTCRNGAMFGAWWPNMASGYKSPGDSFLLPMACIVSLCLASCDAVSLCHEPAVWKTSKITSTASIVFRN